MQIDELYISSLALLCELIKIPSFSKEEQLTAQQIESFLKAHHIPCERFLNNVYAKNKYFDDAKPTILLNSHHDTVKPNKGYTLNPFMPQQTEEKLFGLGSNDAGGCLVSLIAAFIFYYNEKIYAIILFLQPRQKKKFPGIME